MSSAPLPQPDLPQPFKQPVDSGSDLLFSGYDPGAFYDEMVAPDWTPRPGSKPMFDKLANMPLDDFAERQAGRSFLPGPGHHLYRLQ